MNIVVTNSLSLFLLQQMLLILQMINDKQGQVDKVDFANRLYNWMRFGFEELGDFGMS